MRNADGHNLSGRRPDRPAAHPRTSPDPSADCPGAQQIAAYVDGRLSADDTAGIEAHMATCDACLAAVGEVRAILAAPAIMPPAALLDRAKRLGAGRQRRNWRAVSRWAASAAAGVAIALAGYSAGSSTHRNRQMADRKVAERMSFGLLAQEASADASFLLELDAPGGER
jgi:anti-sigma factor RsiW